MLKIEEVMKLWQMTDDLKKLVNEFVERNLTVKLVDEDIYEYLKKYSRNEIMDYVKDTYTSDEVLETFSKYDLRNYLSNSYDPDDFVEMDWSW